MRALVIRGATSTVAWTEVAAKPTPGFWQCTRDQFRVAKPTSVAGLEAAMLAIAQHSQPLTGAITQVVELDL